MPSSSALSTAEVVDALKRKETCEIWFDAEDAVLLSVLGLDAIPGDDDPHGFKRVDGPRPQ